jgi:hypothetical protein
MQSQQPKTGQSAFRQCEKKYKYHKDKKTDFSNIIDFQDLSKNKPEYQKRIRKVVLP